MNPEDSASAALAHVDSNDREQWVRMAMALKSGFGDDGFAIWDNWSRSSEKYRERDAIAVWRSVRAMRHFSGVGLSSLYWQARRNGWAGEAVGTFTPREEVDLHEAAQIQQGHREVAEEANKLIVESKLQTHPYLASKGFPEQLGLVHGDDLIVPMRHYKTNILQTVQRISPDGDKKFLPGGKASRAVFRLGRGRQIWYCEGLCTGYSVLEALRFLYRDRNAQICICFSDGNMVKVAHQRGYVIADNDAGDAGEVAAKKIGMNYWMPLEVGADANDIHLQYGIETLAREITARLF